MKDLQFFYKSYELEFASPFSTSKGEYRSRKGFIIVISDSKGRKGYGDAAPFPEFGSETFEEAEKKLKSSKINLNIDLKNVESSLQKSLSSFDNLPALKHGIEQALLKLICQVKNVSLNELLNQKSRKEININAAIGLISPAETLKKAADLIKQGYTTLKLKAGRDNFNEDLECIKIIRDSLGTEVIVRLDVNGKWNVKQAASNLKQLEKYKPEYVEQPVMNLKDFAELAKKTTIPLAPDESIRNYKDAEYFIEKKISSFIILKPMMLGGIFPTIKIIELAEKNKINSIITTSLDSAVGRAFAVFAASTVSHNFAHGLGTAMYLKNDTVKDPYPVKKGKIVLTS